MRSAKLFSKSKIYLFMVTLSSLFYTVTFGNIRCHWNSLQAKTEWPDVSKLDFQINVLLGSFLIWMDIIV